MKRWRTIGLIGPPTTDGRVIVTVAADKCAARPVQLVLNGKRIARFPVRMNGRTIDALLPWRYRNVTPAISGETSTIVHGDGTQRVLFNFAYVIGLGPGPSAWEELR